MRRFDVEDLPPDRWARIEREVFERLDDEALARGGAVEPAPVAAPQGPSRRAITTFVLAGAAAAIIGAMAWEKLRPATHGEVAGVARVTTDGSATHMQVGENVLDVGAHSTMTIQGNDMAGIEIDLDHGEIDCEVAPRDGRPPFVVSAGDTRVRVVGTHFHVARLDGLTSVSVAHGTVEVVDPAGSRFVHAGESWPVVGAPGAATTAADHAPDVVATNRNGTGATPSPSTPTSHGTSRPASSPSTPQERYEKALELESSQPDVALSAYRELAAGSDAWAMNALFAEARLEVERGHPKDALRLANEYLARFPSGPNARDARELRARLE